MSANDQTRAGPSPFSEHPEKRDRPQADKPDGPLPSTVSPDTLARLAVTGARRLTPANCQIFEGTYSLLHCTVLDDQIYRGVFASLAFPVSHPDKFVCLRYHDSDGKNKEIGLIEDLSVFDPRAQELIRESLGKHYYEQQIERIHRVQFRYGLLFFDVQTRRGREQFTMRWQYDRAQDYGEHGKVLLDTFENRFIIPDERDLPALYLLVATGVAARHGPPCGRLCPGRKARCRPSHRPASHPDEPGPPEPGRGPGPLITPPRPACRPAPPPAARPPSGTAAGRPNRSPPQSPPRCTRCPGTCAAIGPWSSPRPPRPPD